MEPAREAPWAEHEKVYLLAEILKAGLPSHALFNIIRETNLQPKWSDIALPHGTCTSFLTAAPCRRLPKRPLGHYGQFEIKFEGANMNATIPPSDFRQRPQLPAPIIYPGPDIPKKRAHQPESTTPIGRLIQPRPPHSYPGDYVSGPAYTISPVGEPANKKKRGRPTKAEAQARADAAAARGEIYPPPRKARPSVTATDTPPVEARHPGEMTPGPGPGAMNTQPTAVMTPQQTQPPEHNPDSSSGKKKRNKPTPLELEKPRREHTGTESPLAFGSATGDANRTQIYSTYTPISAPLPAEPRDRDIRMEGVEESQPRTTTPRSFKDTVGI
ncbi:hypothetical protein BU24DRAFT_202905 [Aaosphaeria arxii CBS 175.79]|uniref:Uncharacterized protein n=1 Tax=Aaosphaeria arxii CBS 175.79 TaxID=1450172 RepID=A0A6A5XUA2_9PLEO|nr:uncharacterized protein BU24DRAFT_202905 [Aaosphaeria arxii CBS 175.79]KAF2016496.1 hypothetical protein BU24DRAFT_202905 [Aaosphaeria arxii CBS 175.79]